MQIGELLTAARKLEELAHAIAIPDDISPPLSAGEISVLSVLVTHGGPHAIREIVASTGLAQSRVSTIVQSLQRRGWAKHSTPKDDRRATVVEVTPDVVKAARRAMVREIKKEFAERLPKASSNEIAVIIRGLEMLVAVSSRQSGSKDAAA